MSQIESLGIKRLEAIHYYVHDLERSRTFYTEKMDLAEIAASGAELESRGKQTSLVFEAGECRVVVSAPKGEGGRAWRWLRRHPDGVGALVFEVEDIEKTFKLLESREGTPIDDIQTITDENGTFKTFSITTPFGSSTFRFVQRDKYRGIYPGFTAYTEARGGKNRFGFSHFDHITSNFETMAPALLWMEHVMGFERYWNIEFHTNDVRIDDKNGSGLRSIVMWDPKSGVKFANNEPYRPFFKASQINLFYEDNRGNGIQHAALITKDIVDCVKQMRARDVKFMPTPATYYEELPARLETSGIKTIDEDIKLLRDLEILVDGSAEHSYMLQIFLADSAGLYDEKEAGPFFYEIIERKGDRGFGGGNFRALFESIERSQKREGRI